MNSRRDLISKYGPWSILAVVFMVSLLLWSSRSQSTKAQATPSAVAAGGVKTSVKTPSTKPTSPVPKATVKTVPETAGTGQSAVDEQLVKRVTAFETVYYSTRYDETASLRQGKLKNFVGSAFIDGLSITSELGPNQAQLAMRLKKTVVVAKVASVRDIVLGQTSFDTAVATTTVTLKKTGINSPAVTSRIISTTRWMLQSGTWKVLSTEATGGGDTG